MWLLPTSRLHISQTAGFSVGWICGGSCEQASQMRASSPRPAIKASAYGMQRRQTTSPQLRQWWRRRTRPKEASQTAHDDLTESGTQPSVRFLQTPTTFHACADAPAHMARPVSFAELEGAQTGSSAT